MKSVMIAFLLLAGFNAFATSEGIGRGTEQVDYICEAYCHVPNDGFKLLADHAPHPIDALNALEARCSEIGNRTGRLYLEANFSSAQATYSNACKVFNAPTCN